MLSDEPEDAAVGREKLRDYINATLGFEKLARLVDKSPKSLTQMFSARGNPSQKNLAAVLGQLKAQEGVSFAAMYAMEGSTAHVPRISVTEH